MLTAILDLILYSAFEHQLWLAAFGRQRVYDGGRLGQSCVCSSVCMFVCVYMLRARDALAGGVRVQCSYVLRTIKSS